MTAASWPRPALPDVLRRALVPADGWLSLALVLLMSLTIAWSVDDAGWVLGRGRYTDFLAPMALAGALIGFVAAISGVNRWLAHVVTAVTAALVLPLVVGTILLPAGGSPGELLRATAESARGAWYDIVVLNETFTTEIGHHLLALGILAWGSGHFAAYAVFGHRRPLDAVVVLGIVLIGNMALTRNDQLWYLVGFSIAALLLLSRHHAIEEAGSWLRRRIGDPSAVRSLYQTGGAIFVTCAVIGALTLTATASSAPLQGAWRGIEGWLIDVSQSLQRFLPIGGATRPLGSVVFGDQAPILGVWTPSGETAMRMTVPQGEVQSFYWRAVVYDRFSSRGWSISESVSTPREPGEAILAGLSDDPAAVLGRREVAVRVEPIDYSSRYALSPEAPVTLDRSSELVLIGEDGRFGAIDVGIDPGTYTITALVPVIGDRDNPDGLTKSNLIAAGEDYPADIIAGYTHTAGAIGPEALKVLEEVRELSPSGDPFHLADTMEKYLRSPEHFTYSTDVQAELAECGDLSIVECFAVTRRGYCQYYASMMAILLREEGIPTRLAQGFLPGERDRLTGVETVTNAEAHAWVEVYFPGYGWVMFDPTGGDVAEAVALPSGRPRSAAPSVGPSGSAAGAVDDGGRDPRRLEGPDSGGQATPRPSPAVFIVVAMLLGVSIAGLGFLAWRRGPRGEVGPEAAWRGITRLAARLGFGPRPTQTVYEYAATLGDILPTSRPELETVAQAKVEVVYGNRVLGAERMRAIREAHRQLRVALLRLVFRRRERRARRRP